MNAVAKMISFGGQQVHVVWSGSMAQAVKPGGRGGGESKYWAASCWYLTVWLCEVLFQKQEYDNVPHIAYAYASQFPMR